MLKIKDKIKFQYTENLMKQEWDVVKSINDIDSNKNLLKLKIIKYLDKFLTLIFPKLFALRYKIVLEKNRFKPILSQSF